MKDSTTFISCHEFEERFDIKSNFLPFQGLIAALKSFKQLNRVCLPSRNKNCEDCHDKFLKTIKANRVVYERLVRINQRVLPEVKKNVLMIASLKTTKQRTGSRLPTSFQM